MQTDLYTKVVLTPIAVGLFANAGATLVRPAFATSPAPGIQKVQICDADNDCVSLMNSSSRTASSGQRIVGLASIQYPPL
jgi:hypothetical protein